MTAVSPIIRIIQLLLDMLNTEERDQVLKVLNKEQGLRENVARLYTDKEVAERYEVHFRTARKWISNGALKGFQINGRWYSRADWLDEFERGNIS